LCDGNTRREMQRAGALAFAGLTLADLLRLQALSQSKPRRSKSVIMIWLRGGPSHIDGFDMKPNAPAEIRGEFRPTATNVAGINICGLGIDPATPIRVHLKRPMHVLDDREPVRELT